MDEVEENLASILDRLGEVSGFKSLSDLGNASFMVSISLIKQCLDVLLTCFARFVEIISVSVIIIGGSLRGWSVLIEGRKLGNGGSSTPCIFRGCRFDVDLVVGH